MVVYEKLFRQNCLYKVRIKRNFFIDNHYKNYIQVSQKCAYFLQGVQGKEANEWTGCFNMVHRCILLQESRRAAILKQMSEENEKIDEISHKQEEMRRFASRSTKYQYEY